MQSPISNAAKGRRSCAYCNAASDLTREHVLPKFISVRYNERGYDRSVTNVKADGQERPRQAEVTVGDVCRTCNNGFLSELDSYAAGLYDQFFAIAPRPSGKKIRFAFDFDRLLRWLLKLAYNAGRCRRWQSDLIQPLRDAVPYIKGEAVRPASVRVFLQLIVPERLSYEDKLRVKEYTGQSTDEILPDYCRIGVLAQRGLRAGYLVAMNGYLFWILFRNPESTSAENRRVEKQFFRETWGAKRLDPSTTHTIMYPSSLSILDVAKRTPFVRSNIARTARWVEQRKNRRK